MRPVARPVARLTDPWRTAARAQLRDDAGAFALAALGLRLPGGEAEVADRLAGVLGAAGPRVRLTWPGPFPRVVAHPHADVVVVRAAPDGSLTGLRLHAGPALDPATRARLDEAILAAANRVRALAQPRAAPRLARALHSLGGTRAERSYVRRVLAATVLVTEPGPAGLSLPGLRPVTPFGQGVLEVRCLPAPGGATADLWVRVQHVALDGAPMEELVTALRAAFGVARAPVLTPAKLAEGRARSCSRRYPADDPVGEVAVLGVADLRPVLAVRSRLAAAGVPMTLAALLGWLLTRHPALGGEIVAVPVDLPATATRPRTTTVVACDPGNVAGVAGYAAAFGAELALARRRANAFTRMLRTAALLPLPLLGPVARAVPGSGRGVTGTLGVSVLKRSEVFVPAINDAYRAYLGIGDAGLPTVDGGTAAAVVLKCRRGELRVLAAAVDEVLTDPDRFAGAPPA